MKNIPFYSYYWHCDGNIRIISKQNQSIIIKGTVQGHMKMLYSKQENNHVIFTELLLQTFLNYSAYNLNSVIWKYPEHKQLTALMPFLISALSGEYWVYLSACGRWCLRVAVLAPKYHGACMMYWGMWGLMSLGKNSTSNHMINLSLRTAEAMKVKDDPDERPSSCKVTVLKHINKPITVDPASH